MTMSWFTLFFGVKLGSQILRLCNFWQISCLEKEGQQGRLTRSTGQLHGPSQRDQSAPRKPFSGLFLPVPSKPLHFIDHMILSRNTNGILRNPHPCLRNKKEILGSTHPFLKNTIEILGNTGCPKKVTFWIAGLSTSTASWLLIMAGLQRGFKQAPIISA